MIRITNSSRGKIILPSKGNFSVCNVIYHTPVRCSKKESWKERGKKTFFLFKHILAKQFSVSYKTKDSDKCVFSFAVTKALINLWITLQYLVFDCPNRWQSWCEGNLGIRNNLCMFIFEGRIKSKIRYFLMWYFLEMCWRLLM